MTCAIFLSGLSLLVWVYLAFFRGRYWHASERLADRDLAPQAWPRVAAIVPARDEAGVVGQAVASILAQDYPGRLDVILVDDHSSDGTAQAARAAAARAGDPSRLTVVAVRDLPSGWSGKVWALSEGLARAERAGMETAYLWLSDADIVHAPRTLRRLAAKAEAERRDLVSLMAALHCRSAWERLLIPPFVYFFQMLYPFFWVNDPGRRTAAAAGGCVLVRRAALKAAGGFAAIQGALIDDCALARQIKSLTLRKDPASAGGGIWLGLAQGSRSIRPYTGLDDIWGMVARTAYTQLGHNPWLLAGTLIGMAVTYLVPPLGVALYPWHGSGGAALLAATAWALMAVTAWPTFRAYDQAPWRAPTLPVAAAFYAAMTLDSARRHWRGRGGAWKGRVHRPAAGLARPRHDL